MVDPTKITTELSTIRADFPLHVIETQKQAAKFFSDVNDLTSKTLRGIFESQTELVRLEVDQASKAFLLPKVGEGPGASASTYCNRLHEQTERIVAQARTFNDVIRNYGWSLLELYTDNYRQTPAQAGQNTFVEGR